MAFAGIMQAIAQVQHLARHGNGDPDDLTASLKAILVTDPNSIEDVYPDKFSLRKGYQLIGAQLGDKNKKDLELTRYMIGVLALERKLTRNDGAMAMLAERINQVRRQLNHFEILDEQVVANLASIYSDIISNLGPKIQIIGNPACLQRPLVQQKIRALLLSAMRSAVLWRQLGGQRRQLIFARKSILDTAKRSLTL